MTILIVDDNQVNLFLIEKILKRAGYEDYLSFLSAREMFEYLQIDSPHPVERPADLILMDIMMPEIDGIVACQKLQETPHTRDIPVIFVTALEDSNKVAEALDVGGMDYVMKPINKTELLARIRVVLRLKYEKDWHKKQDEIIRNELELSMQVQTSLLSEPVNDSRLKIKASYLPANTLAGDMYYWHKIDENRYAVILLDMMGHGISASLVCMFISSVLRDLIRVNPDPEHVIRELNRWMGSLNNRKQPIPHYFTAIYMVIDSGKKTIEYVNAGHPSGYAFIDGHQLAELKSTTWAVGFFETIDVEKKVITYEDSAQLLLFTDGVPETAEKNGLAEVDRLKEAASADWGNILEQEPIDLLLSGEQQTVADDDMCVVLIRAT
ncbi:fused response regulator/phosphatase [Neobacillus notoginsengisoli]|uniref:Fused response regulator/phosphatase n=1 Tax=Neobacillus notoginsengisoli TaxID=1578198 RepID=A0A417YRA5_9BACI|nr:fused response regulator/phosphatase [Neobacillus notoginsengisoli]RHW37381.1 fused response regulator/phosphatase [Neobacillus notoginsengisoli]